MTRFGCVNFFRVSISYYNKCSPICERNTNRGGYGAFVATPIQYIGCVHCSSIGRMFIGNEMRMTGLIPLSIEVVGEYIHDVYIST